LYLPPPPKKKPEKVFFGQFSCKILAFSGKKYVKFGNFVNFSGTYHKSSGRPVYLANFSGKNNVKFGHFVNLVGLTENAGHENDGPSKLQGMKMQDMK